MGIDDSTGIGHPGGFAGRIPTPIGVILTIGGLAAAGDTHPAAVAAISNATAGINPILATGFAIMSHILDTKEVKCAATSFS
jgi:hypothetical protein